MQLKLGIIFFRLSFFADIFKFWRHLFFSYSWPGSEVMENKINVKKRYSTVLAYDNSFPFFGQIGIIPKVTFMATPRWFLGSERLHISNWECHLASSKKYWWIYELKKQTHNSIDIPITKNSKDMDCHKYVPKKLWALLTGNRLV